MMSSLYIGATGMKTHGEGMSVVTNNLSNVNTVGFKQTMMLYQDMVSQTQTARSNFVTNLSQVGHGAMVGDTRTLFTQMAFESGSAPTDIGISGTGFFGVTKNGVTEYTRAGNFRFTKTGELVDPSGWNVMGRKITNGVEAASATPIAIDFTAGPGGVGRMAPKATTAITAISQLGGITDKGQDTANPYSAMAGLYDGTQSPPLSTANFSYSEPIQYYDSNGQARTARIYYDLAGEQNGMKVMEYLVAVDPSEDGSGKAGTKGAGLLMGGTLTFSSNGQMQNMTAFTPPASGNPADLSGWSPAALDAAGHPVLQISPKGAGGQSIGLDLGLSLKGSASGGLSSLADANANPQSLYAVNTTATRGRYSCTAYGDSAAGILQSNDGYAEGYLRDLTVRSDGLMVGRYSNGETQDLCRITLYRFTSQDGLRHEGSNHYSAGPAAGQVTEGVAGTENFGSMSEYSLEQSNVDYAREFATMIVTQRGFQMNSKVVTTSDQMLQKALELKRS